MCIQHSQLGARLRVFDSRRKGCVWCNGRVVHHRRTFECGGKAFVRIHDDRAGDQFRTSPVHVSKNEYTSGQWCKRDGTVVRKQFGTESRHAVDNRISALRSSVYPDQIDVVARNVDSTAGQRHCLLHCPAGTAVRAVSAVGCGYRMRTNYKRRDDTFGLSDAVSTELLNRVLLVLRGR